MRTVLCHFCILLAFIFASTAFCQTVEDDDKQPVKVPKGLFSVKYTDLSVKPDNSFDPDKYPYGKSVKPDSNYQSKSPFIQADGSEVPYVNERYGANTELNQSRNKMDQELAACTQRHEKYIPKTNEYYNPDGSVKTDHPEYETRQKRWEKDTKSIRQKYDNVNNNRIKTNDDVLNQTIITADGEKPLRDCFVDSGSKPSTIKSDVDLTPTQPGAARSFAESMANQGHTVVEFGDRYVIPETDTVVHKGNTPETIQPGSSMQEGKIHFTSDNKSDVFSTQAGIDYVSGKPGFDPEGATLDNMKKYGEGMSGSNVDDLDFQVGAKSADKIIDINRMQGDLDPEFLGKLKGTREHLSLEESGVVNFGDNSKAKTRKKKKFSDSMNDVVKKGYSQSHKAGQKRLHNQQAKLKDPNVSGSEKARIRQEMADEAFSKKILSESLVNQRPEMMNELMGNKVKRITNKDGSVTYLVNGRPCTRGQMRQLAVNEYDNRIKKVFYDADGSHRFLSTHQRPGFIALDYLVTLYSAWESAERAHELALNTAADDENPWKTVSLGTLYSLTYMTGIPDSYDLADEKARQYDEEYRKALARGEDPSILWNLTKSTCHSYGSLLYGMTVQPCLDFGKAIYIGGQTLDAIYANYLTEKVELEMAERYADNFERHKQEIMIRKQMELMLAQLREFNSPPKFDSPETYAMYMHDLKQQTWEQAKKKYPDMTYKQFEQGYMPQIGFDPVLGFAKNAGKQKTVAMKGQETPPKIKEEPPEATTRKCGSECYYGIGIKLADNKRMRYFQPGRPEVYFVVGDFITIEDVKNAVEEKCPECDIKLSKGGPHRADQRCTVFAAGQVKGGIRDGLWYWHRNSGSDMGVAEKKALKSCGKNATSWSDSKIRKSGGVKCSVFASGCGLTN